MDESLLQRFQESLGDAFLALRTQTAGSGDAQAEAGEMAGGSAAASPKQPSREPRRFSTEGLGRVPTSPRVESEEARRKSVGEDLKRRGSISQHQAARVSTSGLGGLDEPAAAGGLGGRSDLA